MLHIAGTGGQIEPRWDWYENFELPVERERGLGDHDAHRHVADAFAPLEPGGWVGYVAGTGDVAADLDAAMARRRAADRAVLEQAIAADPVYADAPGWVMRLVLAADLYRIVRPIPEVPDGRSIVAGYPWFGDWGRDTMISLPGLCLATGPRREARLILAPSPALSRRDAAQRLSRRRRRARNTTPSTPRSGTSRRGAAMSRRPATMRRCARVFPVLASIVEGYTNGTRYGIGVDPADGLLHAGEPGVQLTWMDARVGDWVVTPRMGKPVEINALWYNALVAMAALAERHRRDGRGLSSRRRQGASRVRQVRAAGRARCSTT